MSEELDYTSTDAMHWSKQLVKTATEQGFTLEQVLDDSWLVGWFANYWAAIHDPLVNEIEQLRAKNNELKGGVVSAEIAVNALLELSGGLESEVERLQKIVTNMYTSTKGEVDDE